MRGRFLHELLAIDCVEYVHGKVPATARDPGYKKYYRVILEATNLAKMEAGARADPSGPVARFLQLRRALDAEPELR
eukprot:6144789-Prymnesium_polylepis.1